MATKHAARDLAQLSGHSEADCRDVLAQCDGDIDRAVDKLLNSAYPRDATRRDDDTHATGRIIVCPQGGGRGVGADFLEVSKVFPVCVGGGRFLNCDPSFLFLVYFLSHELTEE